MDKILNKKIAIIFSIVLVLFVMLFLYLDNSNNNKKTGGSIDVDFGFTEGLMNREYGVAEENSPKYTDHRNRFSFRYPESYNLGNFNDDIGETILIQQKGEKVGFQIYITYFDEPGRNLTPDRIREELPDVPLANPVPVYMEGELIGISFIKNNDNGENSREIWIAKNGFLYQMTTYQKDQGLLKEILETWEFLDN